MADLRDYTKKNPIFVGTDGIRLPTGNNAQRTASSNVAGTMRYNTDINGLNEYRMKRELAKQDMEEKSETKMRLAQLENDMQDIKMLLTEIAALRKA